MMDTIKTEFASRLNMDTTYTLTDLKKILSEVYKEVKTAKKENEVKIKKIREKRQRDENGDIIKKRPASAYNIFIKEQIAKIKEDHSDLDSKTVFKMAIDVWKKSKEDGANDIKETEDTEEPNEIETEVEEPKEIEVEIEKPKEIEVEIEEPKEIDEIEADIEEEDKEIEKVKKTVTKKASKKKNSSSTD